MLSLGASFVSARRVLSLLQLPPLALATWQTGLAGLTLLVLTNLNSISAMSADPSALWGADHRSGDSGNRRGVPDLRRPDQKLGAVGASGTSYIAPVVAVIIGAAACEQRTS